MLYHIIICYYYLLQRFLVSLFILTYISFEKKFLILPRKVNIFHYIVVNLCNKDKINRETTCSSPDGPVRSFQILKIIGIFSKLIFYLKDSSKTNGNLSRQSIVLQDSARIFQDIPK